MRRAHINVKARVAAAAVAKLLPFAPLHPWRG
jgi:hypothetical protein